MTKEEMFDYLVERGIIKPIDYLSDVDVYTINVYNEFVKQIKETTVKIDAVDHLREKLYELNNFSDEFAQVINEVEEAINY